MRNRIDILGIVAVDRHGGHWSLTTHTFGPKIHQQYRRFYFCITAREVSLLEMPRTNVVIEIAWLDLVYMAAPLLTGAILCGGRR